MFGFSHKYLDPTHTQSRQSIHPLKNHTYVSVGDPSTQGFSDYIFSLFLAPVRGVSGVNAVAVMGEYELHVYILVILREDIGPSFRGCVD